MKRMLMVSAALCVLVLSGCTTDGGTKEGVDVAKAAEERARLGLGYLKNGNYERAMLNLNKAIEHDKRYGPAHHYLGILYSRLGEYEKADEHYRDAIYYSENDYDLYNNYGTFLCSQKRYKEGERQLLEVLANPVYPRKDQLYENLGLCVEPKPDLEEAEKYYRKALQLNPRLPSSLLAMARISFSQDNFLGARAFLARYAEVVPQNPESLWLGIRVERALGDRNAVGSYGLQLKNKFPESEQTKLYLQSGGH